MLKAMRGALPLLALLLATPALAEDPPGDAPGGAPAASDPAPPAAPTPAPATPAAAAPAAKPGAAPAAPAKELTPEEEAAAEAALEAEEAARSAYNRELRTVEQEVGRLKERVFRSKATLQLLKELVIEGATLGSRVVLWHINKMGAAYTLESVQYFLDGKNVFTRVDPNGSLDERREIKLHEQTIPPGAHSLQVHMVLRGSGFGVFSYLKTYSFKVHSSYTFTIEDGKQTTVRVIANERSGKTFVERPNVRYEVSAESLREE